MSGCWKRRVWKVATLGRKSIKLVLMWTISLNGNLSRSSLNSNNLLQQTHDWRKYMFNSWQRAQRTLEHRRFNGWNSAALLPPLVYLLLFVLPPQCFVPRNTVSRFHQGVCAWFGLRTLFFRCFTTENLHAFASSSAVKQLQWNQRCDKLEHQDPFFLLFSWPPV